MKHDVLIWERATRSLVTAILTDEISDADLIEAERTWKPVRDAAVARLRSQGLSEYEIADQLQNAHWKWTSKIPLNLLLANSMVGIKYAHQWQGLALLEAGTRTANIEPDLGKPLVYVDYLESAPWNLKDYVDAPRFGLIGARLMEYAVRHSLAEGFHGRVGLLALPRAEEFYEKDCGMIRVEHARRHSMDWFEMTRDGAAAFLSNR